MSVPEVVNNLDELNGQTVTVGGYLAECGGYNCELFTDHTQIKGYAEWWTQFFAAVRRRERPAEPPPGMWQNVLNIGSGNDFDRKARNYWNSYVLITGKVTNMCRHSGGEPGCTDRSPDLEPTSIRPWKRPSNA